MAAIVALAAVASEQTPQKTLVASIVACLSVAYQRL
jgi:hypothetical protein